MKKVALKQSVVQEPLENGQISKLMIRFLPQILITKRKLPKDDLKLKFENLFPDRDGSLKLTILYMKIGTNEKKRWMNLWLEISNKKYGYELTVEDFCKHFGMERSVWVQRMFDIMNYSLSGRTTFAEFLKFCSRFIVIDKKSTLELCFRLLSRRGTNFMKDFSVIDVDDIKHYLSLQYVINGIGKLKKRALDVIQGIAVTSEMKEIDGAIFFDDFMKYCQINPVFVQFTHRIQSHIRMCLFGMPYWIKKSRHLKIEAGSMVMISTHSNTESENFVSKRLLDSNFRLTKNERFSKNSRSAINDNVNVESHDNISKAKSAANTKYSIQLPSIFQRPISPPKSITENKFEAEEPDIPLLRFGGQKKSMLLDNGILVTTKASSSLYSHDFPEAERLRIERKFLKIQKLGAMQNGTIMNKNIEDSYNDLTSNQEHECDFDKDSTSQYSSRPASVPKSQKSCKSVSFTALKSLSISEDNILENSADLENIAIKDISNTEKDPVKPGYKYCLTPMAYIKIVTEDEDQREEMEESSYDVYLERYLDNKHQARSIKL